MIGTGNFTSDGADLANRCRKNDGLCCDRLGEGCGLGDGGFRHSHVDGCGGRLGERQDEGSPFAIDAEDVTGQTLGVDDGRQSRESEASGGGKHGDGYVK